MTATDPLANLSTTCHALIQTMLAGDTRPECSGVWQIASDAFEECDSWTWEAVEALVLKYPRSNEIRLLAAHWLEQ
jgi:hypothetical protein